MQHKFTPGPWTAKPFDRTWVVCFGGDEYLIGGVHLNREANARLIAAAPELLEALKDAYPYIDNNHLRQRIGAVIAKAEGITA